MDKTLLIVNAHFIVLIIFLLSAFIFITFHYKNKTSKIRNWQYLTFVLFITVSTLFVTLLYQRPLFKLEDEKE